MGCEVWLEDLRDTAALKGVELREDKYHYHTYFMRGYSVESALSDLAEKQIVRSREMKWISVEDRLPSIAFQTVLCFCAGGNISTGQFYGQAECERSNFRLGRNSRKQYGKNGRWFELAEKGYKVTHWMPLPEPPKEAE